MFKYVFKNLSFVYFHIASVNVFALEIQSIDLPINASISEQGNPFSARSLVMPGSYTEKKTGQTMLLVNVRRYWQVEPTYGSEALALAVNNDAPGF